MPPVVTFELSPGDTRSFSGNAYIRMIGAAEEAQPVKLYYVRFEPGARTFWHSHQGRQILVVTAGRCRFQRDGSPIEEIGAGESVAFEEGVRHWHGATADAPAEHIAINLAVRETDWYEEVVID